MFDWIKNINKDYPEFWKKYISKFEHRSKRFVALSLESSGTNPEKDVIFSFGSIGVFNNAVVVGDEFEIVIPQYKFLHDNEMSNEFIIESRQEKMAEPEAVAAWRGISLEDAELVVGQARVQDHRASQGDSGEDAQGRRRTA